MFFSSLFPHLSNSISNVKKCEEFHNFCNLSIKSNEWSQLNNSDYETEVEMKRNIHYSTPKNIEPCKSLFSNVNRFFFAIVF